MKSSSSKRPKTSKSQSKTSTTRSKKITKFKCPKNQPQQPTESFPTQQNLPTSSSIQKTKNPYQQQPFPFEDSKNNSEYLNNNPYTDFSANIVNEKRTKDSLRRLISTSNDLLTQQNQILTKCDELAKIISTNDYEIDRMKVKQESQNFPHIVSTYSSNLEDILDKLRKNTKELETAKKMKEENNSLRYKIEMLSIDKSDDYLNIETELHSVRNVYSNEINSMINFLNEIGVDNTTMQKVNGSSLTEDKVINFFTLVKKQMKMMKMTILAQEEQIKTLSHENMKLNNEIDNIKRENEIMNRPKHMDVNNYYNSYSHQNNYNNY